MLKASSGEVLDDDESLDGSEENEAGETGEELEPLAVPTNSPEDVNEEPEDVGEEPDEVDEETESDSQPVLEENADGEILWQMLPITEDPVEFENN